MTKGLHHASVTSHNLERLVRFYCDRLGFEQVLNYSWKAGSRAAAALYALADTAVYMAMPRTSNACFEIFEFKKPRGKAGDPQCPECDASYTHICLHVDDVDVEYVRLSAAGMQFHCSPQEVPGLCRATYGRDADGNSVELMQPAPEAAFAQQLLTQASM